MNDATCRIRTKRGNACPVIILLTAEDLEGETGYGFADFPDG
jgi:hypothetical protein